MHHILWRHRRPGDIQLTCAESGRDTNAATAATAARDITAPAAAAFRSASIRGSLLQLVDRNRKKKHFITRTKMHSVNGVSAPSISAAAINFAAAESPKKMSMFAGLKSSFKRSPSPEKVLA